MFLLYKVSYQLVQWSQNHNSVKEVVQNMLSFLCRRSKIQNKCIEHDRIAQIFKVKSAKQLKLGDKDLAKRLLPICGLAASYLVAWTVSSPAYVRTIKNNEDLKIYYCSHDWWQYAAILGNHHPYASHAKEIALTQCKRE